MTGDLARRAELDWDYVAIVPELEADNRARGDTVTRTQAQTERSEEEKNSPREKGQLDESISSHNVPGYYKCGAI